LGIQKNQNVAKIVEWISPHGKMIVLKIIQKNVQRSVVLWSGEVVEKNLKNNQMIIKQKFCPCVPNKKTRRTNKGVV
jgi:hypothetical protein